MPRMRIVEVGPRDGLQYEATATSLTVEEKITFIRLLAAAGVVNIEAGSFVSPKAVPQMAGSKELALALHAMQWPEGVHFSYLVPNLKGLECAQEVDAREIAIFVAASDAFSLANINATVEESFLRVAPVVTQAKAQGMKVRGYLSTIFGGPKGEVVTPEKVTALTQRLLAMGCYEVSLGDTTGIGTPETTSRLLAALAQSQVPFEKLACHFHDTGGRAIENVAVAWEQGIRSFDSAAGGLGGCPYAESPKGNLATEDLLWFCQEHAIETGIELEKLMQASRYMLGKVGKTSPSKAFLRLHAAS